jgi:hypothetical protein
MSLFNWLSRGAAKNAAPGTPPRPTLGPLADLMRGATDDAGYMILDIYARKPPDYAVYRNEQRVAMQFADRADKAAEQRKMMSSLNPLRGEINGLIDGWRYAGEHSGKRRKALRYDRRVADALIAALEGDVDGATALLTRIRQDIVDERTANARLLYVGAALGVGAVAVLAIALFRYLGWLPPSAHDLFAASVAGAFGAFFSIALAMRNRTVLLDLLWLANLLDALLRMVIGLIAAAVLMAMVDARLVNVNFGELPSSAANSRNSLEAPAHAPTGAPSGQTATAPATVAAPDTQARDGSAGEPGAAWLQIVLIGFIAGFSERFVPDLLAKAVATAPAPAPVPAPQGAAAGGKAPPEKAPDKPKPGAAEKDGEGDGDEADDPDALAEDCPSDTALAADDVTPDASLPAASGGVSTAAPAGQGA